MQHLLLILTTALAVLINGRAHAGNANATTHELAASWVTTVIRARETALNWGVATVIPAERDRSKVVTGTLTENRLQTKTSPANPRLPHVLNGIASFYWQDQMTASGEVFQKRQMTAAHPTLPFNSRVRVTNLGNGRSVVVRINDRGPFKAGRVIDLSEAAATEIGMQSAGLAAVKIDLLQN